MFALHLYQRLAEGNGWERDLTQWARFTWRRTIRAIGGYWVGDFVISGISQYALQDLYSTMIGKRVLEWSFGRTTWEGEIVGLSLSLNGVVHEQSLDSELWHDRVKTQFTYPSIDDVQQGVLAYVLPGGDPGFQDTLQDFSDWEVLAGDAIWEITVTNNDTTTAQGYLGEATITANPDDSIWIFEDIGRGIAGWNGDVVAKVPISYEVKNILLAGTQQETSWVEQEGASDIYGESEYIDVLADEGYLATAEAARDRRLSANAYPRSIPLGGLSSSESQSGGGDQLSVTVAGYVFSMNRRFHETNVASLDISTQIATLVTASEFVTDGGILENITILVPLTGANITTLLWDAIEGLTQMGATGGIRYVGHVDTGRVFRYDLAETEVLYEWANGRLQYATGQPVFPTEMVPDILVRLDSPLVTVPPGASVWNSPTQTYIQEVEFIAPRSYRLIPEDGDILEGTF